MAVETSENNALFAKRIEQSLAKAELQVKSLRSTNSRLGIASLSSSAVTTVVAGVTAAAGPLVGEGIPAWRSACIVAAIFGLVGTISAGLLQQFKFEERLLQGNQCIGKLKALDVALATGRRSLDEIGLEYEELARQYPEYIL